MHGRRKIKTTEDKLREKKEADKLKAAKYSALMAKAFELRNSGVKGEKELKMSAEVLSVNPDCYSFWTWRREIVQHMMSEKSREDIEAMCQAELKWIEGILQSWPKSYWIWFHRRWISQHCNMNWARELELCLLLHKADSRNFHCWNYRRFAVEKSGVKPETELSVAQHLIEDNFSNYSAWHHRSVFLLKTYHRDSQSSEPESGTKPSSSNSTVTSNEDDFSPPSVSFEEVASSQRNEELFRLELGNEFKKVQDAIYTDPNDQSAWFYHKWLIGMSKKYYPDTSVDVLEQQLQSVDELLEMEDGKNKWAMLTLVNLMLHLVDIDLSLKSKYSSRVTELVSKLVEVDTIRSGYYKDLELSLSRS